MSAKRYALNVLLLSFFNRTFDCYFNDTALLPGGSSVKSNAAVSDKYGRQLCYEYQLASICR